MKKLIILIAAFLGMMSTASAQQEAIYMHYMFNPSYINPGATGYDDAHHDVFMNVRSAWTNFPGTPKSYALNYNGAFGKQFGLGALLFTENIAAITRYRAQVSYAYKYQIKKTKLGIGFTTEFNRLRVNNTEESNPFYEAGDLSIEEAVDGKKAFDVTLGFYGSWLEERVYAGLTLPSLIRARIGEIGDPSDSGVLSIQHFTVNVGGNFDLPDYKMRLEPSIMIRSIRDVPFQVDFNAIAYFLNDQLITGFTYRAGTGGNLGLYLGTKFKTIRFVYSYDLYFREFQTYNGGSHEVTVNFEFDRKKSKYDRSKKYRGSR